MFLQPRSLLRYKKIFLSSYSIASRFENDHPIFGSDLSNRFFVIYTNSHVQGNAMQRAEEDEVPSLLNELLLDKVKLTEDNGRVSSTAIRTCNIQHPEPLLQPNESSLKNIEENQIICDFIEFLKQVATNKGKDITVMQRHQSQHYDTWISYYNNHKSSFNKLISLLRENSNIGVDNYNDCISKTLICYNQMCLSDLDIAIKRELENILTISPEETERAFGLLVESVKNWREKESYYLDENCQLWADIARNMLTSRFDTRRSELLLLGVIYEQEEVTRLQKELSQDYRVYSVECGGKLTTATTLKVLQVLEYTGESYVLVTSKQYVENEELVLKTWLNKWCSTLIIEITSNYMLDNDLIGNLYKALAKCTSCLIIIFPRHSDTIAKIFQNTLLPCKRVIDSLAFNQFDRESQNRITSKKFNFQGQLVSLTDIFKTEALEKSPQDVISRLFFENYISIGSDISKFKLSNYIPRYLEIPHISKDILYQNNGDAIAVETITSQISTTDFRNKGQEMANLSVQRKFSANVVESFVDVERENHIVLEHSNEKSHFETLCKEITNVHWIKECNCKNETLTNKGVKVYNTNKTGIKNSAGDCNNFVWKKSKGNITTVRKSLMKSGHYCCYELTFISQDLESPVLITGEPGIGKSCLLKNLATLIKQRFPTKWVVLVDLPQHCNFINTLKTVSEKDVDNILEKSLKLSDADIDFWKETRSNFENCVIMLDAFDEMSPHYAEKVKQVIRYLNTTSCFLYITTRRSTVADLENDLSVISYNVKLLNQEEGEMYFKEVMMSTSPISEKEAELFSRQVTEKYSAAMITGDTFLMSNPLHIKLLAEMYLDIIEENTNILNIYQIYSAFVERKVVQIYKKANSDIHNPAIKNQLKCFIQQFNDYNKNISAEQIFPEVKCSTMGVTTVQSEISSMCQKVGVIDEVVDGIFKYVHRSFTDYFAALWLKENYKGHHAILIDVMCKTEYDMIKKFYDMSLSEDLPLHSAALSRDEDRIESLLSRGADVNNVDKMQRTPLHLAASYNHVKKAQTLLETTADIRLRDVLDWTPIDYAIKTYSWEVLDLFLGTQDYEEKEKLEISERIFQIWRENIQHHKKPNRLLNEEKYPGTLVLEKLDLLYICLSKGHIHLLENISKLIPSSNKIMNLNQVIAPHWILDIEDSSNVQSNTSLEYIPLHVAAEYDQLELVSHLIEKYQCDIDIVDCIGRTALIIAYRRGNIDIVKYLLDRGADIHIKVHNGKNTLHYACEYGHLDVAKYLIEKGVDINHKDNNKRNVLHHACYRGYLDIIKYCVEQGANIHCLDENDDNLLILACSLGHLDIVKFCLEKGLDINDVNKDGENGLMKACLNGYLDIVKYYIQHGANIHARDNDGCDLLFYACMEGNLDIIRYCVQMGAANISSLDRLENNLLKRACSIGHLDIVTFCLEKGLDINHVNENGANGLMLACESGDLDIVKYCIQHGANIHARDNDGCDLLFYACMEGNLDIIRYCVQMGAANISSLDRLENNLLMCACSFGHLNIVTFCLEKGLDINHVNENGANGLMLACESGDLDIVKYCIQHGANIHARDNDGCDLLFYACMEGNLDIIRYCVQMGAANISSLDRLGNNLLMRACSFGDLNIVKFCLEKGLDINDVNKDGKNGLMKACLNGYLDIVKYCIQHGANIHARDNDGCDLLFYACMEGNLDIIRYCVQMGAANISSLDRLENNLLMRACSIGHLDIVTFCLEKGLDINHVNENGANGLMLACESGDLDIVKYCIQHGANIHARDNDGCDLLFYACMEGNLDIIRYCVQMGAANISSLDRLENNLLMCACSFGHLNIVTFCLEKGLDINHVNENGANGLMLACESGDLDIVKYCIQHGANIHARDNDGCDLLFYACMEGNLDIIRHCVQMGAANISSLDRLGNNLLMRACSFGHLNIVKFCLEKGLDINDVNKDGKNGLMVACLNGYLDIVKYCIQHGANIHARDNDGCDLLFYACMEGNLDIIRYCVQMGAANISSLDRLENNLLMRACIIGHLDIVTFCLEKGLDINHVNENGANGLMLACESGDLDIVKYCIQHGANIHARDNDGCDLLFYACMEGNLDIIRYCVQMGAANISSLDRLGNNLLMRACSFGHLNIVKFFLEKGLDINDVNKDGKNGLMVACLNGYLDIVKYCIQHGANIHARDNNGRNLLFHTSMKGNLDILRYCVEQGADVNCLDKNGNNLLMCMCTWGHLNIVKFCLEKGLDINDVNKDGENGLMKACKARHLDIVKYFIQHGANIHARDNDGRNLLFYACESGTFNTIRYCVEQGANISSLDRLGNNLLMCACSWGHLDIVEFCLEKGLDINHVNKYRKNGLMMAFERGHLDIVKYCIQYGANLWC